ncbi:MAG: winged helix-turn-helix transcriptional regulator [Candidatus ainarchaeum sp.]|nr:winged helix-turn-helix transcriptional regulator [Candidatus ainarchaeum sp.]
MKKLFVLFILLLTSFSFSYYADVIFDVQSNGDVLISGYSDYPDLQNGLNSNLTSKNGGLWIFNFDSNEIFLSYVFELRMPENTEINYLNISGFQKIKQDNRIIISGFGENSKLNMKLQYSSFSSASKSYWWTYLVGALVLLSIVGYVGYKKYRTKPAQKEVKPKVFLTDREKQILDLIKKNKGQITQHKIQQELGLPKSSLSRNLLSLEKKGLIKKSSKGLSNVIVLQE